jgi:hypothetical protein
MSDAFVGLLLILLTPFSLLFRTGLKMTSKCEMSYPTIQLLFLSLHNCHYYHIYQVFYISVEQRLYIWGSEVTEVLAVLCKIQSDSFADIFAMLCPACYYERTFKLIISRALRRVTHVARIIRIYVRMCNKLTNVNWLVDVIIKMAFVEIRRGHMNCIMLRRH